MTIKQLEKMYADFREKKDLAAKRVEDLEAEISKAKARQAAALEAEDLQGYRKERHAIEDMADELAIERKKASRTFAVKPEDVISAWNAFLEGYTTEAGKLDADVDKEIKKLGETLRAVSEHQRTANEIRNKLAEMMGMNPFEDTFRVRQKLPLKVWAEPSIPLKNRSCLLGIACLNLSNEEQNVVLSGFPAI